MAMDFNEAIEQARAGTEFIRSRKNILFTFGPTKLPYICVCERGDGGVLLREGEVTADRPAIAIPGERWNFEGFSMDGVGEDGMVPVLIARGIHIPPLNYTNTAGGSRTVYAEIRQVLDEEQERLERSHDIRTGLFAAPDEVWKISVLLYVAAQIARSAPANVAEHMERLRLRGSV